MFSPSFPAHGRISQQSPRYNVGDGCASYRAVVTMKKLGDVVESFRYSTAHSSI